MKKLTDVDRCWPMLTGYSSHILSSHEPIWKLETGWRLPTWSILLSILKWSASIHLNPLNPWDPGCRCRSIETLPAGWRKPAGSDVSSRRRSAPRAPGNTVISANFFGSGVFRLSKYSNHIIYNVYNVYIYIYRICIYMYTRYMRIWPFSPSEAAQGRWRHGWPKCWTVVLDSQEAFDTFESCAVLFPTTIMCRIGVALEPNLNLKNQPVSYVSSCFIIFLFKNLLGWVLWVSSFLWRLLTQRFREGNFSAATNKQRSLTTKNGCPRQYLNIWFLRLVCRSLSRAASWSGDFLLRPVVPFM